MQLGVCYYPEHWPEARWPEDAQAMRALGIARVRIAEFAWSRIEPAPGRFTWEWLDRAIDTLADAGLAVTLCTPTATPPRWLVKQHPDILAVGEDGRVRGFGSRRHYCFSSPAYRAESRRIVTAMAQRYGEHPAVDAWQTDNEYGCHATVISYSDAALHAFRAWLTHKYRCIDTLNTAWGTRFWSQEYSDFDDIDLPVATVTEANPAQRLDFRRFSSDQVVAFNREQVDVLRALSPGRTLIHNSMGLFSDYDHYSLAADLDAIAWDSYPLGFLDTGYWSDACKRRFLRTGHPDVAAFHHDLYRGVGRGRFWVMEQQPGPVNWAGHNPAPLPGMVRLWSWEAFAHGAEVVSYFRWRQVPFAQEQMHTGLLRSDGSADAASAEAGRVAGEIPRVPAAPATPAQVALVFDYPAQWLFEIQPHGRSFDYKALLFTFYSALRRLGLDVDVVPPGATLTGYRLVVIPSLPLITPEQVAQLWRVSGAVLVGPRSGSRTADFQIPAELPPGPLQALMPLKVVRVESLRAGVGEAVQGPGYRGREQRWCEHVQCEHTPEAVTQSGRGAVYRHGRLRYLAVWPDAELCRSLLASICAEAGLDTLKLEEGLRLRRRGEWAFAFNYAAHACVVPAPDDAEFALGDRMLAPAGVAAWRGQKVADE